MTDAAPTATSQPPVEPTPDLTPKRERKSRKYTSLTTALIGAMLALLANAAITQRSHYLTRRDQHVREAPDLTPKRRRKSRKYGSLTTALIGAMLALFANAAVAQWSNYLTRRDQHVQEADQCNELAESLISVTSFARDAAQADASALAKPLPSGSMTKSFFILPPIDEILHSQDQALYIIDSISRNIIFQLEAYYRTIRDDLSHTPDVKAEGDTFALMPDSPNRQFYANLLRHIAQEAGAAAESLGKSRAQCDVLAKTGFFSSRPRPRASAAMQ